MTWACLVTAAPIKMPCQTFFSSPSPFFPTGHEASSGSPPLLRLTLSHTGPMENTDPSVNERHKATLARRAGANLKAEIPTAMAFISVRASHFQRTFCSPLSATGEWLSLWGKRKAEIERRDWGRNKQEAQRVGEMERRRKTREMSGESEARNRKRGQ